MSHERESDEKTEQQPLRMFPEQRERLPGKEQPAEAIFNLHATQRFPELQQFPVFSPAGPIDTISSEALYRHGILQYTTDVQTETLEIPIYVQSSIYTITTQANEAFVFLDNTNALIPTDDFFSYAKEHDLDLSTLIIDTFCSVGFPSEPGEFEEYLEGWEKAASAAELGLNKERIKRNIAAKIKKGEGTPMQCHLALPPTNHQDRDSQIAAAIDNILQNPTATEELTTEALQEIYREPAALTYLALYDGLPGDIDIRSFQYEKANEIWKSLSEQPKPIEVFNVKTQEPEQNDTNATQLEYLATVLALRGKSSDQNHYRPFFLPQLPISYSTYVSLGIIETNLQVASNNLDVTRQILETTTLATRDKSNIQKTLDAIELSKVLHEPEKPTTIITWQAAQILHLEDQQRILANSRQGQRLDSSYERESAEQLGRRSSLDTQRIYAGETPPHIPIASFIHRERITDAPYWEVLTGEKELKRWTLETYARQLREGIQMLRTDFWSRQIEKEAQRQVVLAHSLVAGELSSLSQQSGTPSELEVANILRRFDQAKSPFNYATVNESLDLWVKQTLFARQANEIFTQAEALHFPILNTNATASDTLRLGEDYHTYHLVAKQSMDYIQARSSLEQGLDWENWEEKRKDMIQPNLQYTGMRLHYIITHPNREIPCWNSQWDANTGQTSLTLINLTPTSRAFVYEWFNQHQQNLPSQENDPDYYAKNTAPTWGEQFLHHVTTIVSANLKAADSTTNISEQRQHLQIARQAAYAFYQVYEANVTNISSTAGYPFDYVLNISRSLEKTFQPFGPERITPPGEITLNRGEVTYLLGPNGAGKSSVMRQIGYAVLLEAQGLPQTGSAEIPPELKIQTVMGTEKQKSGKSLLGALIPGINRLTELNERTLLLLDEPGNRTSKQNGQTIALAAPILALYNKESALYMATATHYHSTPQFAPLLLELGITPQFIVVDGHHIRPLREGEQTKSNALAILQKYAPGQWLSAWPDEKQTQTQELLSRHSYTENEVIIRTIQDLYGERKEREFPLGKDTPPSINRALFELFSDPNLGLNYQAAIEEIGHMESLPEDHLHLDTMVKICELYNQHDSVYIMPQTELTSLRSRIDTILEIPATDNDEQLEILRNEKITALTEALESAVNTWTAVFDQNKLSVIGKESLKKEKDFKTFEIRARNKLTDLHKLKAFMTFAQTVIDPESGFCKVQFTTQPGVTINEMWNPQLNMPRNKQITNDVTIDFTDERAGMFISGENSAGKTNHIRSMSNAIHLALTTGYASASAMAVHPDVRVLSLTQPIGDETTTSSMSVEARDRFALAVQTIDSLKSKYVVAVFDEPAAPTSPEEAGKAIVTLYDWYNKHRDRARLIVTSQADQVPGMLEKQGIPADLLAFRLLTKTPFKAFPGTYDTNAIEVMHTLGLDNKSYKVLKIVHEYIQKVESGGDAKTLAPRYASRIKKLYQKSSSADERT